MALINQIIKDSQSLNTQSINYSFMLVMVVVVAGFGVDVT